MTGPEHITRALPPLRLGKDDVFTFLPGLGDQIQEPFRELSLGVLIPDQFRRQAGVVPISLCPPRLMKLILKPYIGS